MSVFCRNILFSPQHICEKKLLLHFRIQTEKFYSKSLSTQEIIIITVTGIFWRQGLI